MTGNEIPPGWTTCDLSDVLDLMTLKAVPGTPDCPAEFVGMDDVESESGRITNVQTSSSLSSAGNVARPGDILYGRLRPYLNKVAAAPRHLLCSGELLVLRPREGLDPTFMRWLLRAPAFLEYAVEMSRGDRPRVYWSEIAKYRAALPPAAEQERITEELERRLSHLEAAERGLTGSLLKLNVARGAIVEGAISGVLGFADGADAATGHLAQLHAAAMEVTPRARWRNAPAPAVGTVPATWASAPLGQLAHDADYGTSEKCSTDSSGLAVVRIPNIRSRAVDLADLKYLPREQVKDDLLLTDGDVLFVRSNGSRTIIGVAAASGSAVGLTFASYLIRFRMGDPIMARWIELVAAAPSRRRWLVEQASSSAGQHNLGQSDIAAMPIPVPSREDMVRILSEFERRQSLLDAAERTIRQQLRRCTQLRHVLLDDAFAGRLVPQDSSDEPAWMLLEQVKSAHMTGAKTVGRKHRSPRKPRTTKEKSA